MTVFASGELSGRRIDQPPAALFFESRNPADVDADHPFVKRTGRRSQAGGLVRFAALVTPTGAVQAASLSVAFGSLLGRLVYDDGLWSVASPDAEGDAVPVAESGLLEGVEYAVSLTISVGDGLYRDVVVDGRKVAPQVVDTHEGPAKPPEEFVVDILSDGSTVPLPEWAAEQVRSYSATELLQLAREHGGRIVVSHQPAPDVEQVPRPAPLLEVEGEPVFTFAVEASGPLTVERAWAVEA